MEPFAFYVHKLCSPTHWENSPAFRFFLGRRLDFFLFKLSWFSISSSGGSFRWGDHSAGGRMEQTGVVPQKKPADEEGYQTDRYWDHMFAPPPAPLHPGEWEGWKPGGPDLLVLAQRADQNRVMRDVGRTSIGILFTHQTMGEKEMAPPKTKITGCTGPWYDSDHSDKTRREANFPGGGI